MQKSASAAAGGPDTAPGKSHQTGSGVRIPSGLTGGRLNMKPKTKSRPSAAASTRSIASMPPSGDTLRNTGSLKFTSPRAARQASRCPASAKKSRPSTVFQPGNVGFGRAVFAEAGGEANGVKEMQAGHTGRKPVIVDTRHGPHRACGPAETRACRNREMMRGLRIEAERERTNKLRIGRHFP